MHPQKNKKQVGRGGKRKTPQASAQLITTKTKEQGEGVGSKGAEEARKKSGDNELKKGG